MSDLNTTLEALGTELAGLLSTENATPETVSMTLDQFVDYCKSQIELAKADTDPAARVEALKAVVDLAKAYSWENGAAMSVPVYSGPLSRQAQSAEAEKIAEHPGRGLGVPGPEASPSNGAFEAASGITGPATHTARAAERHMPPALPMSTPAAGNEGFIAKAALTEAIEKAADGQALLDSLKSMLDDEATKDAPAQINEEPVAKQDDGWPADLSTKAFLDGEAEIPAAEDFGTDPAGLGRGKHIG